MKKLEENNKKELKRIENILNGLVDWAIKKKGNEEKDVGWHVGQAFSLIQDELGTIWKNDKTYDVFLIIIENLTGIKYYPQYALYDVGGHDRKELVYLVSSENGNVVWEA
jgi:hypothetical protein